MRLLVLALLGSAGATADISIEQYHAEAIPFSAVVDGNPFDVELFGEFTGPDGARLRIPGYYDGAGIWKIRFSPTRLGRWSVRTTSSVAVLNNRGRSDILCVPNKNPNVHGGLRVDRDHPHHFVWEDGARYFLLGYECDWLWALDPPGLQVYIINQIAARGFNHVLLNVYAHDTTWSPGRQRSEFGPPQNFPWEGTNDKPDHSRFNPFFFTLYDQTIGLLHEKGIVAHIMLKVYNKMVNWPPAGSREEERYFRYVTARYQGFSNVVWDFSKEAYNEKDNALQKRLIDLIRSTDAYHRLTTVHDDDVYDRDPALNSNIDFRSDQQHDHWAESIAFDRALRPWPVVNVEFGYERGVEDLPTYRVKQDWQEVLRRAYLIYLAGGYGAYYYSNTAWDLIVPNPEPPGYARFQQLKETLSALPYWRMSPASHLAVGGPCLALEGEAYACYAEGARLTVNLSRLPARAAAHWVDTWTGRRENIDLARPGVITLDKPRSFGAAPGLFIVR